jgi:hypothetical protein
MKKIGKSLLFFLALVMFQAQGYASYLLDVNIPSSVLQLIEVKGNHKHVLKTYAVVLGARAFQTPVGSYQAIELTYNPGWIPPNTAWAKGKDAVAPTQNGPLGPAALRVNGDLLIHGSPAFNAANPFASHGCVRMDNKEVRELMSFLQDHVANTWGKADLAHYDRYRYRQHIVNFKEPIAVNINYNRVLYHDGQIVIHEDPYKKDLVAIDVALLEVLKQEGLWGPKVDLKKMMQYVVKADSGLVKFDVNEIYFEMYQSSKPITTALLGSKNFKS